MHTHIHTFHTFSFNAVTSQVMAPESLIKLLANTFFIISIELKGKLTYYLCIVWTKFPVFN